MIALRRDGENGARSGLIKAGVARKRWIALPADFCGACDGRRGRGAAGNRHGAQRDQREEGSRDQHALAPIGAGRRLVRRENPFDPPAHRRRPRHGERRIDALPASGHVEQNAGVVRAVFQRFESGVVADDFRKFSKPRELPPGERVEPEHRAIDRGEQQHIEIAVRDVGALVGQHGPAFCRAPGDVVGRQQDGRPEGDRNADGLAHAHVDPGGPGRAHRPRRAGKPPREHDADDEAHEQHAADRRIDRGRGGPPIERTARGDVGEDITRRGRFMSRRRPLGNERCPGLRRALERRRDFGRRPDDVRERGRRRGRNRDGHEPHQRRHRQRGDEHQRPGGHLHVRISHAKEAEPEPYGGAQEEGTQRRFQQQRQHHFFPPLAFATLSARRRNCRWSSMDASTMPTSTSSIEPLQNQSTMRCTALAATRPRGAAA